MRELVELLERLRELGEAPAALVTVARVEGSSYRREGARMLVEPDGRLTGVLTGGCLERDLVALASEVLASGEARTARFDLTAEEEAYWGTGTGCAGRLTLLVEPLGPGRRRELSELLATVVHARREVRVATVFERAPPPDAAPLDASAAPGLRLVHPFAGSALPSWAAPAEEILATLAPGSARPVELESVGSWIGVLLESILPPVHLLLVGSERDAPPLARLGRELGWKVTVVDPRPTEAASARFEPPAEYLGATPGEISGRVELSPRTAAVLATHRYLDDLAYVETLLAAPLGYLALLGPVRRRERLLSDLARRSPGAADAARETLRGPAGLDLGGRSPHEVALAIVAEIQAVFAGRSARPLTEREGRDARDAPLATDP